MDGKKMSFAARIVDDPSYPLRNDIDGKRDFVLTYYVVDGTMGILSRKMALLGADKSPVTIPEEA